MKLNIDVLLWTLGKGPERYIPDGYYENDISLDESLEVFEKIEDIQGVYVQYSKKISTDPNWWLKKLNSHGLKVSNVAFDTWSDKKWKNGSISSSDKYIRNQAIKMAKETIDFAKETKAYSILLWPATDGFDYMFQNYYEDAWSYMIESLKEICDYAKDFKVCIEQKPRDPREKSFISNTGKTLYLIDQVGYKNLGTAIDTGHTLLAGENIAESVVLFNKSNRIHQIHLNDNYRDADPDMLFGTINFWDMIEFFYFLNKTNYDGWCLADLITKRDDRIESLKLCVKLIKDFKSIADKLMEYEETIDENMRNYRLIENINILRKVVFGKED